MELSDDDHDIIPPTLTSTRYQSHRRALSSLTSPSIRKVKRHQVSRSQASTETASSILPGYISAATTSTNTRSPPPTYSDVDGDADGDEGGEGEDGADEIRRLPERGPRRRASLMSYVPPQNRRRSRSVQDKTDKYLDSLLERSVHALELSNALLQSNISTRTSLQNVINSERQLDRSLARQQRIVAGSLREARENHTGWMDEMDRVVRGVEELFEEDEDELAVHQSWNRPSSLPSPPSTLSHRGYRPRPPITPHSGAPSLSEPGLQLGDPRDRPRSPPPRALTQYVSISSNAGYASEDTADPQSIFLPSTVGLRSAAHIEEFRFPSPRSSRQPSTSSANNSGIDPSGAYGVSRPGRVPEPYGGASVHLNLNHHRHNSSMSDWSASASAVNPLRTRGNASSSSHFYDESSTSDIFSPQLAPSDSVSRATSPQPFYLQQQQQQQRQIPQLQLQHQRLHKQSRSGSPYLESPPKRFPLPHTQSRRRPPPLVTHSTPDLSSTLRPSRTSSITSTRKSPASGGLISPRPPPSAYFNADSYNWGAASLDTILDNGHSSSAAEEEDKPTVEEQTDRSRKAFRTAETLRKILDRSPVKPPSSTVTDMEASTSKLFGVRPHAKRRTSDGSLPPLMSGNISRWQSNGSASGRSPGPPKFLPLPSALPSTSTSTATAQVSKLRAIPLTIEQEAEERRKRLDRRGGLKGGSSLGSTPAGSPRIGVIEGLPQSNTGPSVENTVSPGNVSPTRNVSFAVEPPKYSDERKVTGGNGGRPVESKSKSKNTKGTTSESEKEGKGGGWLSWVATVTNPVANSSGPGGWGRSEERVGAKRVVDDMSCL